MVSVLMVDRERLRVRRGNGGGVGSDVRRMRVSELTDNNEEEMLSVTESYVTN